jgi:DNA polymerase-1
MIAAFQNGDDLHALTARQILGKDEVSKEERQLAKAIIFGTVFGMAPKGLQSYSQSNYGVEMSEADAERHWAAFYDGYPGLWARYRRIARSRYRPIETRTLIGRRCRGVDLLTKKLNTPIQGSAADGLKMTLSLLYERRHECPNAVPAIVVHDEVVLEVLKADADAVVAWLRQAAMDAMGPMLAPVPVEIEVAVLKSWGG